MDWPVDMLKLCEVGMRDFLRSKIVDQFVPLTDFSLQITWGGRQYLCFMV